jgi:replicative DNA helicase
MKSIAKRFGCVVLTAAQLNDDLKMRESRAIKQDADAVFIIRKGGLDSNKKEVKPAFVIDKLRGGNPEPSEIYLELNGQRQRFE